MPATLQPPTPWPPGSPHVPLLFEPTFTQLPVQHWLLLKQISPVCVQNETADEQTSEGEGEQAPALDQETAQEIADKANEIRALDKSDDTADAGDTDDTDDDAEETVTN